MRFCPYFRVGEAAECSAREGEPYRPSEFQEKEYCASAGHCSCPFYSLAETGNATAAHVKFRNAG